jgi:hypothetical protein
MKLGVYLQTRLLGKEMKERKHGLVSLADRRP